MTERYLPSFSYFENVNVWFASEGRMKYKLSSAEDGNPVTELDGEVWEGPFAYEFSEVEEKRRFSLTQEGYAALNAWLTARSEEINARPLRSFAENLARRTEKGETP